MKFLKEDGTIEEGVLLSDAQVVQRQQIEDFLHEKVCANSFHSSYGAKAKCLEVANQLIATLNPSIAAGLCHAMDVLTPKPEPIAIPDPILTAVPKVDAEKDMPF